MENITKTLVDFGIQTQFADLPEKVVHETKRIFLDIIGCAIGGLGMDKGRIAIEVAKSLGGTPEATILGTAIKVAGANAAFANGELMHSLDYCPVLSPAHVAPYVTAAPLALAEVKKASGKTMITALAIAHEMSSRIGISQGNMRAKEGGYPVRSYGFGCNTFGATAGAARILGLSPEQFRDAFGTAGYFAPLPAHTKWVYTPRNGMAKYGPSGWTAHAGVVVALLAEKGYEGDRTILDGEYGFWAMNGSETFDGQKITENLGKDWVVLNTTYKYWPCCGLFGSSLDAFSKVIRENSIKPDEIEKILIKGEGYAAQPRFQTTDVRSHVDAQMSLPYNVAMVAYGIKIGPEWQLRSNIENPQIQSLMNKVSYQPNPKCEEARHQDLVVEGRPYISRRPAYAEVFARGTSFLQEMEYANWLSMGVEEYRASDEGLADKFRANVAGVLEGDSPKAAIDMILHLEELDDMTELIGLLSK
ncbi:MmgE/PrpD family protein [Chloroflexota bacterium]